MKLIHLSIISIIGCLIGLVMLLAAATYSLDRLHAKQAEMSDIITLQQRINDFSVASDSLLLFPMDRELWQALRAEAKLISSRLRSLGQTYPDARKAIYHIDQILDEVATANGFSRRIQTRSTIESKIAGPLAIPPRSRIIMNQIAGHGIALDSALNNVIHERRQDIARQANLVVITFAGLAALFGALAVLAFILIHRRAASPARELTHTIDAIRAGNHDVRAPVSGDSELADVARTLNHLLDEQQAADIKLQKQQRQLNRRERMLAESQRIANIGSWQLNVKENRLAWSDETYRIMDVSADAFRPTVKGFLARVHPDDRDRLLEHRNTAIKGEQLHDIEFRIIRPNDEIRYVHERAEAAFDANGEADYFSGTIQDITDSKNKQAFLEQYRTLIEGSDELYNICDANYRYVMVNQAYARWHGYTPEEMIGKTLPEYLGRDYFAENVQQQVDRCLAGDTQVFEVDRVDSAGSLRTLLVHNYPIASFLDGTRQVAAVITDITALREQARLIQAAGRVAQFGGWSVDLDTDRIEWSDVVAEIHGMPHGYSPSIDEGIRFYTPEYREHIRTLFTTCAEQGIAYDEELQIINQQGRTLWVRSIGEPVYDSSGRIVRVHGAFQDISTQKAAELELEKLNSQLSETLNTRQALINALPAHIALLDSEGNILDVNEQWRHFGAENANPDPAYGVGGNYLQICADATDDCQPYAQAAADGLRSVLNSNRDVFTLEYPCHSPNESRWFRLMVNRLSTQASTEQATQAVVMHVDITERKQAEQELNRLAYQDPLTELPSRNGFVRSLEAQVEQTCWPSKAMVILLDIDGLREVNDAHGYSAGDQLLVDIGERLAAQAGENALVGRIGGDEFAVYLPGQTDDTYDKTGSRIAEVFDSPFEVNDQRLEMDARFGYTLLGVQSRAVENLLREAELALFRSRQQEQPGLWTIYTPKLDRETHERINMTRDLRSALDNGDFQLHFQPKVELKTGQLIGAEALLRWYHPERGLQSPGDFIPIAEQSQLIAPIGDWAIDEACRCLRQWQDEGLEIVQVAVNVSLVQFTLGDFPETVRQALQTHDISPSALSLEITESVFEHESPELLRQLRRLNDMGVRLSLDDFGTGYSSLLYLQQYPFDEIKIDKGFVANLVDDTYSRSIVTTVMGLAGALQADVVAEGVESAAVCARLIELGCYLGQGFYYSLPLEAEDFRWLLEKRSSLPLTADAGH